MRSTVLRLGAFIRRNTERAVSRLPHFPEPKATCPAHGRRYCQWCAANPSTCIESSGECGYWSATGMHWDSCANRIRATTKQETR